MMAAAASDTFRGPILGLLIPALATWRLSHLVWAEDGPWSLIARSRKWAVGHGTRVLECFYCISLWIALPAAFVVAPSIWAWLFDWFAFSGAAILLERLMAGLGVPPAIWREETPPDNPP